MKKIKFGVSFFLLIFLCLLLNRFVLLINYLSALILHELAHLFVAKSKGYSLKFIKFDVFGLSVELNEKIYDKDSFYINISGPILNLLLVLICMALYWLVPSSFYYLNVFCIANLTLAVFNLLPIYPLDGGKIFSTIIKNDKLYNILETVVRIVISFVFLLLFICTFNNGFNYLYLIVAVFFITSSNKRTPTMSIFKYTTNKSFNKVTMLKVGENENLFNLIKKIKSSHYTIFYVPQSKCFIDEEDLVDLATKLPLTTTIKEIK